MRIIFFTILISVISIAQTQNLGKYYPFSEQEDAVGLFFVGKNTYAITRTNILKESSGFFMSKYQHESNILCAVEFNADIVFGSEKGLFAFNKETFAVRALAINTLKEPVVISVFVGNDNKIWVSTASNGIYTAEADFAFEKKASHIQIESARQMTDDAVSVITQDSLIVIGNVETKVFPIAQYMQSQIDDTIRNLFVDENNYIWVVSTSFTNAYMLSETEQGVDTLSLRAKLSNNTNILRNYIYIEDLGFLFSTSRGLFYHFRKVNKDPFSEFANPEQAYKIENLLKTDISQDFLRATGYRRADFVKLGPKGKLVWFVNSSGALGISLKELQKFLY